MGYDNEYDRIILHPHCPFDYCKRASDHLIFPLSNTDLQCENNRSGILCGGCKSGLSLALGSSKCLQCTNLHQLLLLPFALAGIALVLLLLICKLTVAAGTINGLIFMQILSQSIVQSSSHPTKPTFGQYSFLG